MAEQGETANGSDSKLIRTVKFAVVAAVLAGILFIAGEILLLIFAGVLFGVFLAGLAAWVSGFSRLSHGWSLLVVCLILAVTIGATLSLIAPSIAEQFDELSTQLPRAVEKLQSEIRRYSWGDAMLEDAEPKKAMQNSSVVFSRATSVVSGLIGALTSLIIILFVGLYGAAEPGTYQKGFIFLVPRHRRRRAAEVIAEIGDTLQWWLIGKFISMAIIGVLTTVSLWLIGVPLALGLGTIAALLTFIPNIGPILSAVPAVLLGLMEGPLQAAYIAALYVAIQTVESYLITPLIQRRTISLPPGLTLSAQVLFGSLFGGIGVALATPITAAGLVAIKRFYVEDVLGDVLEDQSSNPDRE